MARTAVQKVYADFRQGFVTVANPLAYPEGSLKDIVNYDIQDNGTLRKRPGLRQESDALVSTDELLITLDNYALNVYVWENVDNAGDTRVAVVQIGSMLYLYPMLDSGIDLNNPVTSPINMNIPSIGRNEKISVASGGGWLFVVHPNITPFVIRKDKDGNYLTEDITIKIRDLSIWQGRNDEETGYTTSSLYPIHAYNLRNGGWPNSAVVSSASNPDSGTTTADPVFYTSSTIGKYPSIGTPFSSAKAGGGDTVKKQIAYSPWSIENDYYGNSPVPVGKFIVNAEAWSRNGVGIDFLEPTNVLSFLINRTYRWSQYPTSVEFYADRVWYSGVKGYDEEDSFTFSYPEDDLDVSNTIYFSQQIQDNLKRVGKCYQENDPTAEDINQLLATDGGTIAIRGAGEILDIKTFGTYLIVFASEGLWAISGVDGNSFNATSFSVDKISNIGPASKDTIAAVNNNIYYIANDAIYILTVDEISGKPSPRDITSDRIKDFYNNIPYDQKSKAIALFDVANRNFYMFYSDIEETVLYSNMSFNKCLIFNQDLNCFYKYDIAIEDRYIVGGIFYNKDNMVTISEPVTISSSPVTLGLLPVTLDSFYSTAAFNNIQLLTIVDENLFADFTFSSFTDITDFTDWGEDYTAYCEFGFDAAGDIMRDSLQAPVLISHMERTEDGFEVNPDDPNGVELILSNQSDCTLSSGWDWATNYSRPQQLYRFNRQYTPSGTADTFDYGKDVITTRNRIRGKGHSLGVRLDTAAGKDARILGLGIMYTNKDSV